MYLRPQTVLLYANLVAATACFGAVGLMVLAGAVVWLQWIGYLLPIAAGLSLVFFVGSWLERH